MLIHFGSVSVDFAYERDPNDPDAEATDTKIQKHLQEMLDGRPKLVLILENRMGRIIISPKALSRHDTTKH